MARRAPKPGNRDQERPTPDAYDVTVRELGFEMKAQPSNRMKTEEELAKEEQERLKNLEVRATVTTWPWGAPAPRRETAATFVLGLAAVFCKVR